jgi:ADP-heptose:LPS heptosyltransferase
VKILFIRFSSIGDIVLTSPLLRCTKEQLKDVEIHYVTKKKFAGVIEHNPYITKLFTIDNSLTEITKELKKENYDWVIDLHHNVRSLRLKSALHRPSKSFNKLNFEKWVLVQFKRNKLPNVHIVDRYFETLSHLGVKSDNKGLDYFIPKKDKVNTSEFLPGNFQSGYHSLVAGGSYFTKQIPKEKIIEIIKASDKPIVLLGGPDEREIGDSLQNQFPEKVFNACGKLNLNQSASIIEQSNKVISSDTGLMHIASAFKKEIHSLWGNTVKEFGMYPYLPGENSVIHEVKGLSCRPCSKLGHHKCPKGHFKCMHDISVSTIFNS